MYQNDAMLGPLGIASTQSYLPECIRTSVHTTNSIAPNTGEAPTAVTQAGRTKVYILNTGRYQEEA